LHLNIENPPFHYIVLHFETIGDSCGHFFNPYINLHLENKFDFFPNASTSTFVVDPYNEVFIHVVSPMPPLVPNPGFHFNIDDVIFASFHFIQVNVPLGNEVGERTDYEYPDREPIPKSWFFEIDDKELENVNKRGQRMSKHVKLWAMNAFNEWRLFHGFNMAKSIVNLFENEGLIKDLVDMLSSFVLQVAKKYGSLYPPTKYNFLPFF